MAILLLIINFKNIMGQLEVYSINEIFLSGLVLSLFINYLAEGLESNTFESFKAYIYSSNLANKSHLTKLMLILTPSLGIYKSWSTFQLNNYIWTILTKPVDDYSIWQDNFKVEMKVDENVLRLQKKIHVLMCLVI